MYDSILSNESNESNDSYKCRICYDKVNNPLDFCNCDGSIGYIHFNCLKKWIKENNYSDTCEICHSRYKLKYTKTLINKNNICLFLFILALFVFLTFVMWYFIINKIEDKTHYIFGGILINLFFFGQSIKFFQKNKIIYRKIVYIGNTDDDEERGLL